MRSSYAKNNYDELLGALTRLHKPSTILEVGILDGFSLSSFANAAPEAEIVGYDLFEDFVGHHSDEAKLCELFLDRPNVKIEKGDFFKLPKVLKDTKWDFCHIDVANCGEKVQFALDNYLPMISPGGLLICEGGSHERDTKPEWMRKYNKLPIKPVLEASGLPYFTFLPFPSMTVVYA